MATSNTGSNSRDVAGASGDSMVALLRHSFDSLIELFGAQLKMAKAEAKADARAFVQRALLGLPFLPVLLAGYAFVMAAIAIALAAIMPRAVAWAVVGGAQIVVGGLGMWFVYRRFAGLAPLDQTVAEVKENAHAIGSALSAPTAEHR